MQLLAVKNIVNVWIILKERVINYQNKNCWRPVSMSKLSPRLPIGFRRFFSGFYFLLFTLPLWRWRLESWRRSLRFFWSDAVTNRRRRQRKHNNGGLCFIFLRAERKPGHPTLNWSGYFDHRSYRHFTVAFTTVLCGRRGGGVCKQWSLSFFSSSVIVFVNFHVLVDRNGFLIPFRWNSHLDWNVLLLYTVFNDKK